MVVRTASGLRRRAPVIPAAGGWFSRGFEFGTVAVMRYNVRTPTVADADALGRTHVRAWREAYRGGLMPDEYLDGLDAVERSQVWREALTRAPRRRSARFVVEADDRDVVGFVLVGPADGDPEATLGELYAINIDPDHWETGLGAALIDHPE